MAGTKKTAYQKLQNAKKKQCAGKATAADVNKAATAYVADAVKKGNKTKAEAEKSANKVKNSGCAVSGVKRKKTTKKK
jgi:hypothetical protein